MTDIPELTEYVKNHGTDHEARWKLSKKLYDEGEYDRAVYHLEIVKQYKVDSANVVRYLAAAYYRLNRYDDAVKELRAAIKRWPDETGLREQLGRVLHVAGRLEESLEAWRDLARLAPDHSTAGKMVARSEREIAGAMKKDPEPLRDSELGLGQAEGQICPTCGAVNTEEFERCWKCHSALVADGVMSAMSFMESVVPPPPTVRTAPRPEPAELWNLIGGIAAGTIALAALFYALTSLSGGSDGAEAVHTVRGLLLTKLLGGRLILGGALLVMWPLSIWLALLLAKSDVAPWPTILVTGALMASGAFASLLFPPQYLMYLLVLVVLASAVPILLFFGLGFPRGSLVWFAQAVLVTAMFLATAMASQGVSCVVDWPAVARHAAAHDGAAGRGEYRLDAVRVPQQWNIRWESTGSKWLDGLAAEVTFEVNPAAASMELKDAQQTLYFIKPPDKAFRHHIVPGHPYELLISGQEGTEVDVEIRGLLTPKVGG